MDMSASVHHPFLSQVLSYGVKVNPTGLWRSGRRPGRLHQRTM